MPTGQSEYRLSAKDDGFTSTVNKAERSVKGLDTAQDKLHKNLGRASEGLANITRKATLYGSAAIAAGVAITTGLVKSGLQSVDVLAKTSDKLGVTTEALGSLRFAAQQTGVASNELDIALQRFTRRLADAAAGSGPAVKAFEALGLSANELVKLEPDKALARVADAMNQVENQSQKVSIAFKLFDSGGVNLVNTLALGSEGLAEMNQEAEILGLTLSRVDAAQVEQANDAMARIGSAFQGLGQQLAVKFAPLLQVVADRLFGVAKEAGGMGEVASKVFASITKSVGVLADTIKALQVAWKLLKIAFQEAALAIVNGLTSLVETSIDLYNKLPWVDEATYQPDLRGFALTMESEIAQGRDEIDAILSKPLPSDAIEQFSVDVQREYRDMASIATDSQDTIQGAVLSTEDVTASLATTTTKTADSIKESTERIGGFWSDTRSLLSDFFFEIAADGANAFDTLFKGFKALLSTMIAEAAANQVLIGVGGALGFGSSAAVAGGLGGSLSSGASLAGLAGAGLGGLGGLYTGVGNFFGAGSTIGNAALSQGRLFSYGSVGQGLGQLGLNLGAGVLGGVAGNALFGSTTGIGATLGGLGGSIFGPVGAGVGSFLGSGAESLLGNVFGFGGNGGNQAGRANVNLGTGSLSAFGVGNSFDQGNVDTAQALAATLLGFGNLIGGSSAQFGIKVGNRSGVSSDGQSFDTAEAFLADSIGRILNEASGGLDSSNIQQIQQFVAGFDNSADAIQALNQAMETNVAAAQQMAAAIQAVSFEINRLATEQAEYIRESVLTESELREKRRAERNALAQSLDDLTDPAQIEEQTRRILELNRQIFDSLTEEGRLKQAENFAQFAENTNQVAQEVLQDALERVRSTQEDLNSRVAAMLETAGAQQQGAAQTQLQAAQTFLQAVEQMTTGAGRSQNLVLA
jgi:hypothetical protein